jgi:hypothetical protein
MGAAGWFPADPVTLRTSEGKKEPLAFEKPDGQPSVEINRSSNVEPAIIDRLAGQKMELAPAHIGRSMARR